jgi:transposase
MLMVVLGIDAHKRTHTVVAVDEAGRQLGTRTTMATSTAAHLDLVRWADRFGAERRWAVEDCRHLSRRLETDLLAAGEQIVRVPPKLMAHCRDSACTYGKSDPIDALAVARAALREPGLPVARLDGPERELRLLTDHRDDLVAERTRMINRLRWHLHELDPGWDPAPRSLTRAKAITAVASRLAGMDGLVARLAADLTGRIGALTTDINALQREIAVLVRHLAPSLLAIPGAAELTAAKIVAETAGAERFSSKDAYARHNGTAPLPAWSANRTRHRLSRTGNRQLNCAIHRIAVTQARCHPQAQAYLHRRIAAGDTKTEALRSLKRRLSDIVYRALMADGTTVPIRQAA